MKFQQYNPPKATLAVVALVFAIVPILVGFFLIGGTAQSYTLPGTITSATTATVTVPPGAQIAIPKGASSQSGAPGYSPDKAVVVIGVNATVTWTNQDDAEHTVTSYNVTGGAPVFDSGAISPGQTFTFNFTTPGTYTYHCDFHTWMSGVITVMNGTPTTSTTSKTSTAA